MQILTTLILVLMTFLPILAWKCFGSLAGNKAKLGFGRRVSIEVLETILILLLLLMQANFASLYVSLGQPREGLNPNSITELEKQDNNKEAV